MANRMTLKKGFDVNGARTAILTKLYTLTDDDDEIVFPENSIMYGREGKLSLHRGLTGLFGIGDTKKVISGLRNDPTWGEHEAGLIVLLPGETDEVIDRINDISRIVPVFIEENPTMDETGLKVLLPDTNPVLRRTFNIKTKTKKPIKCTGCMFDLGVFIAKMPE